MARKSAEDRREEIIGDRVAPLRRGRLPRHLDRGHRPRGGHLPALSVPAVPHQERAVPGLLGRAASRSVGRGVPRGGRGRPGERAHDAMGTPTRQQLLPDRHALLFQMQAYAISEPEIRAHVREGFQDLVDRVAALAGVTRAETWDFFAYGMLLNVIAALDFPTARPGSDLPPPARDRLGRAGARACVAAVFALPVFGELGNENDFDDPSAEAVTRPRRGQPQHGRVRGAEHRRAGAAGRAGGERAGARSGSRACAAALRDPGVASVRAPYATRAASDRRPGRPRDGRSTYLLATFKNDRGRADRGSRSGCATCRGSMLGGGAIAAPAVGDQVSADIARAELIAFPILFLLTLLVFRSAVVGAAAAGGRRDDDPAQLPRDPGRQRARQPDVDLRPEPDQRARAGAGDRLLAVHGHRASARSWRAARTARRRWRATLRTAGPRRGVLGDHGRVRAGGADRLPAALPVLDGRRRGAVRADRRRRVADAAAGAARACSASASTRAGRGAGRRRSRARRGPSARGFWYRHSQRVMRRPVPVATGAAVLLLALGAPFLTIRFTGIDPSRAARATSPRGSSTTRSRPSSRRARPRRSTSRSTRPRTQVRAYAAKLPRPVAPPRVGESRIDLIAPGHAAER